MYRDHTATLRPGSRAPDFDLPTADGRRVSLESLKGRSLLLFFLRGTWCPNCKKLMKRLDKDLSELESLDLRVLCIAAQRIDGTTGARRFVQEHRYRFPILFDESRQVTKQWGVYRPLGIDAIHIAHPAAFLIDPDRTIRWIAVSPNQYTRPSTAELIEAVEAARAAAGA